jgi:hypothetical protein
MATKNLLEFPSRDIHALSKTLPTTISIFEPISLGYSADQLGYNGNNKKTNPNWPQPSFRHVFESYIHFTVVVYDRKINIIPNELSCFVKTPKVKKAMISKIGRVRSNLTNNTRRERWNNNTENNILHQTKPQTLNTP